MVVEGVQLALAGVLSRRGVDRRGDHGRGIAAAHEDVALAGVALGGLGLMLLYRGFGGLK